MNLRDEILSSTVNLGFDCSGVTLKDPKLTRIAYLEDKMKSLKEELYIEKSKKNKIDLPERYIINENATILFWKNGEKTIVKRASDDKFNPRLAFLTAFFQRYCGMSKNKANKYLANLQVEKKIETKEEKAEDKSKRGRPKKDSYKFKVGDKVIGNKKATDKYCVTREGWIGTVISVNKYYFTASKNNGIEYSLHYEYFDKYKEEK